MSKCQGRDLGPSSGVRLQPEQSKFALLACSRKPDGQSFRSLSPVVDVCRQSLITVKSLPRLPDTKLNYVKLGMFDLTGITE